MPDSVKFVLMYIVMVMAILMVGWDQPIRYHFLSKEEIATINAPPAPTPKPGAWMWDKSKRGNALERKSYGKDSTGYNRGAFPY